nr:MAG TPA: hypothetical protein [Caudoviricetes sp.]
MRIIFFIILCQNTLFYRGYVTIITQELLLNSFLLNYFVVKSYGINTSA